MDAYAVDVCAGQHPAWEPGETGWSGRVPVTRWTCAACGARVLADAVLTPAGWRHRNPLGQFYDPVKPRRPRRR